MYVQLNKGIGVKRKHYLLKYHKWSTAPLVHAVFVSRLMPRFLHFPLAISSIFKFHLMPAIKTLTECLATLAAAKGKCRLRA